jgi:indole-3-glycerol phosphate synthase
MILDDILQNSCQGLEIRKRTMSMENIQRLALNKPQPTDLAAVLQSEQIRLIAEVKKASPSKGIISQDFDPVKIAGIYAENNVAAISVLTENKYFQGNLDYLNNIDIELGSKRPPLLRKDFIFDSYQVYESRAYGADAILLIVAILKFEELKELLELSHRLQMKCLVEVHNENEVNLAVKSGANIIGINNRDLRTFTVDINNTARLLPLIPGNRIVVSESGIKSREDMQKLQSWGVKAALVGETLMAAPDIAKKIKELI